MSESIASEAGRATQHAKIARQGAQRKFFFGMSLVMLVTVFLGFSRSFFLSAFLDVPEIPPHLHVHGAVLTGWFLWFAMQTFWVTAGRTDVHRRLGVLGVALGVAVVVASAVTSLTFWPRMTQLGIDIDAHLVSEIVWLNIAFLICFSTFLAAAISLRHRPEVHKRFMLLASLSILPPATTRILDWPIWRFGQDAYFPLLCVSVLPLVALALYDIKANRTVHPVTLGGSATIVGLFILGAYVVPGTAFGSAVVYGLYDFMR